MYICTHRTVVYCFNQQEMYTYYVSGLGRGEGKGDFLSSLECLKINRWMNHYICVYIEPCSTEAAFWDITEAYLKGVGKSRELTLPEDGALEMNLERWIAAI